MNGTFYACSDDFCVVSLLQLLLYGVAVDPIAIRGCGPKGALPCHVGFWSQCSPLQSDSCAIGREVSVARDQYK